MNEPMIKPPLDDEELVHTDDTIIGKAVRWSLLVLIIFAALFGGALLLLKRKSPPPLAQVTRLDAPVSPSRPQAETPAAKFIDITREAGITFVHNNGAYGEKVVAGNDGKRRGLSGLRQRRPSGPALRQFTWCRGTFPKVNRRPRRRFITTTATDTSLRSLKARVWTSVFTAWVWHWRYTTMTVWMTCS